MHRPLAMSTYYILSEVDLFPASGKIFVDKLFAGFVILDKTMSLSMVLSIFARLISHQPLRQRRHDTGTQAWEPVSLSCQTSRYLAIHVCLDSCTTERCFCCLD